MAVGRAAVRPSTAFNSYVNNQRNKNKASTDSTFVLKSADFQQATPMLGAYRYTIAFILTRLGIIDAAFLRENRKYSIVTVFIAAAILTPPDVFTQTLMAAPLIILYEISIWVSWFAQPKKSKKEASAES